MLSFCGVSCRVSEVSDGRRRVTSAIQQKNIRVFLGKEVVYKVSVRVIGSAIKLNNLQKHDEVYLLRVFAPGTLRYRRVLGCGVRWVFMVVYVVLVVRGVRRGGERREGMVVYWEDG